LHQINMSLSDNKKFIMLFTDLLRRIREEKQIPQKRLAAALDIDTPMFSRIERGERLAKREQVIILAKVLELDENYLINIWMADKIYDLIKNENQPIEILEIVKKKFVENER
jgi:transcriptional regulator with XRE-family HTH domain